VNQVTETTDRQDLGTLGGPTASASAMNDAGDVVGLADTPTSTDGFLWSRGKMTDLGTLPGDCFSGAFGINGKSQVVGQSFPCDGSPPRAFLWENGEIIDLNMFVPPGSDLALNDVETINANGEMFGMATLASGDARAFVLIPCDENHPGIEGCDYSLVEAPAAVTQPVPAIRYASGRALPPSLTSRMSRFHFPGRAFGPRN